MAALTAFPLWLLPLAAVLLFIAIATFLVGGWYRTRIGAAMQGADARKPLGMFSLSSGNAAETLRTRALVVPELLWTYDADYLERFATAASGVRLPDRQTALAVYIGPTLCSDIAFAVALGLFVALTAFAAAVCVADPLIGGALIFCGVMGAVYGAADVAENLKLIAILKDWRATTGGQPQPAAGETSDVRIDGGEAGAANALTRIKFVTLTLSIVGLVVGLVLVVVAAVVYRPPGDPRPATAPG